MPLANMDLYDALREIGVSEPSARRAAEAAAVGNRELLDLRHAMQTEFAAVHTELAVLRSSLGWLQVLLGVNLSLVLLILGKLFIFPGKP